MLKRAGDAGSAAHSRHGFHRAAAFAAWRGKRHLAILRSALRGSFSKSESADVPRAHDICEAADRISFRSQNNSEERRILDIFEDSSIVSVSAYKFFYYYWYMLPCYFHRELLSQSRIESGVRVAKIFHSLFHLRFSFSNQDFQRNVSFLFEYF